MPRFRGDPGDGAETSGRARAFDGIVIGWVNVPIGTVSTRAESTHLLRVQTARSAAAARRGDIEEHELVLNRTQLRQLGESLIHSADRAEGRSEVVARVRRWFG